MGVVGQGSHTSNNVSLHWHWLAGGIKALKNRLRLGFYRPGNPRLGSLGHPEAG